MTITGLTHTEFLNDDAEVCRLIRLVQSAPVRTEDALDADGNVVERTVYGSTPESEAALVTLIEAFLPLLRAAAYAYRQHAHLDEDDVLSICVEEFISCVRRHVLDSALPFKSGLKTILLRRLDDESRLSGLVSVTQNRSGLYRQLLAAHGGEGDLDERVRRAYEYLRQGNKFSDLTAETFLDVHRAMTAGLIECSAVDDEDETREYAIADTGPGPEAETVQAETVRWLFALPEVSDLQESILRLRFGFTDEPTENLRRDHGFKVGEVLSDRQVAGVVGSTTPTVQRKKALALAAMRAALLAEVDEPQTA